MDRDFFKNKPLWVERYDELGFDEDRINLMIAEVLETIGFTQTVMPDTERNNWTSVLEPLEIGSLPTSKPPPSKKQKIAPSDHGTSPESIAFCQPCQPCQPIAASEEEKTLKDQKEKKLCMADGCKKTVLYLGHCQQHYFQHYYQKNKKMCKFKDGCEKVALARRHKQHFPSQSHWQNLGDGALA